LFIGTEGGSMSANFARENRVAQLSVAAVETVVLTRWVGKHPPGVIHKKYNDGAEVFICGTEGCNTSREFESALADTPHTQRRI
jgi:hypothetical protein